MCADRIFIPGIWIAGYGASFLFAQELGCRESIPVLLTRVREIYSPNKNERSLGHKLTRSAWSFGYWPAKSSTFSGLAQLQTTNALEPPSNNLKY